jgi:hypothetical protein
LGPVLVASKRLEAVSAVEGADLAADEPVRVLTGVEVVQGALEVEGAPAVAGEQQDKRRIPHKQTVVEGGVHKVGDEPLPGSGRRRLANASSHALR